jgi:hypothetical protein
MKKAIHLFEIIQARLNDPGFKERHRVGNFFLQTTGA